MDKKQKTCYRCGFLAATAEVRCPRCRRMLHTVSSTRIRGALLVAGGIFLTGFMGYLMLWALAAFSNPSPSSGVTFSGTEREKLIVIGIFAVLILFGLSALITGSWQLFTGRRSRMLSWSVSGLGAVIAIGTVAVIFFLG